MSTSQPPTPASPEHDLDEEMSDTLAAAPHSPIEPTAAQLQASGVLPLPQTVTTSTAQSQASNAGNGSSKNGESSNSAKSTHGAPGSSWSNKKFLEEYDVAVQKLCHQEFDPAKYGDPLIQYPQ